VRDFSTSAVLSYVFCFLFLPPPPPPPPPLRALWPPFHLPGGDGIEYSELLRALKDIELPREDANATDDADAQADREGEDPQRIEQKGKLSPKL
jgi:hypothetical protein